jgi:hypothetical protein
MKPQANCFSYTCARQFMKCRRSRKTGALKNYPASRFKGFEKAQQERNILDEY